MRNSRPTPHSLIALAAALLVGLTLVACGPSKTGPDTPQPAPSARPEEQPDQPVQPETQPEQPAQAEPPALSEVPDYAVAEEEEDVARGPYDKARLLLDDVSPNDFRAKQAEIEGLLREALAAEPNSAEIWYNFGVFQLRAGQRAEAQKSFQKAAELEPTLASAHAQLGVLMLETGNVGRAREYFAKALELHPYNPVAHVALASLEISAGKYAEAVSHARQALLADSKDMNAYLALGTCYYEMQKNDLGKLICLSALDINPNAAPLWNLLGLFDLRDDDVRGAISRFSKAIETDPELLDARMNLGATTLANGDFDTALQHFEFVLERRPDDVEAMTSRAVALRGLERFPEAKVAYEEVLKRSPGDDEVRYNLCILYQEYIEDYQAALTACQEYMGRIDRKHLKYREMVKRLDGIKMTLEALRDVPATPPPVTPMEPAPEGQPAPEAQPDGAPET